MQTLNKEVPDGAANGRQQDSQSHIFGFWLLPRLLWKMAFGSRGTAARFTIKRFFVMLWFMPWFLISWSVHNLCFLLDDLFFPGYKKIDPQKPVFIVGVHRSGTTYLHHLLSEDETFTSTNLGELLVAPSIVEQKAWALIGRIDRLFGGFGRKLAVAVENRIFKDLRKIHHTSLFEPEEDELAMIWTLSSMFLLLAFPFPERILVLAHFDTKLSMREQDRIMGFYKRCVQRHLYVHGPEKRFLSKNPIFSSRVEALRRTFPDCTVVCNVRSPYQAVPSLLSMLSFYWNNFDNDFQGMRLRDLILEMADSLYKTPMDSLPAWPKNRHAFLLYDDLTADPEKAVLDLYERCEIPLSDSFRAYLKTQHKKMRSFKSRHSYSMDQWDLSQFDIYRRYEEVFRQYNFPASIEPAASADKEQKSAQA